MRPTLTINETLSLKRKAGMRASYWDEVTGLESGRYPYGHTTRAARPDTAIPLYERVIEQCRSRGFHVETGRFGEDMQVESVNDGPVTIFLDTKEL